MPFIKLTAFHTVEGLFVIRPLVDRLLRRRLLFLGCQNSGRSNRGFPCSGNQSQFKNARSFFLVNIGILSRCRVKRPRKAWEGFPRPPWQFYNRQLTKKNALAYADLERKARTPAVLLRSTVELNQESNEKALNTSKGTEWSGVEMFQSVFLCAVTRRIFLLPVSTNIQFEQYHFIFNFLNSAGIVQSLIIN